jgi:hypothetical protein
MAAQSPINLCPFLRRLLPMMVHSSGTASWFLISRLQVAYFCNSPDPNSSPAPFQVLEASPGLSTTRDTPNGEESCSEPLE